MKKVLILYSVLMFSVSAAAQTVITVRANIEGQGEKSFRVFDEGILEQRRFRIEGSGADTLVVVEVKYYNYGMWTDWQWLVDLNMPYMVKRELQKNLRILTEYAQEPSRQGVRYLVVPDNNSKLFWESGSWNIIRRVYKLAVPVY